MKGSDRRVRYFVFIIILGALTGTFIGDILGNNFEFLSFLKETYKIGIGTPNPLGLDLKVIDLKFACNFNVNIMSIIGSIMAIIIYRNY